MPSRSSRNQWYAIKVHWDLRNCLLKNSWFECTDNVFKVVKYWISLVIFSYLDVSFLSQSSSRLCGNFNNTVIINQILIVRLEKYLLLKPTYIPIQVIMSLKIVIQDRVEALLEKIPNASKSCLFVVVGKLDCYTNTKK